MLSTFCKEKTELKELIENLKRLPQQKQEYVNGYVHGIADTIANRQEKKWQNL